MEEAWTGAWPQFLEEDLERFMLMTFIGTDGEVKVGTLQGSVRPGFVHIGMPRLEQASDMTI